MQQDVVESLQSDSNRTSLSSVETEVIFFLFSYYYYYNI